MSPEEEILTPFRFREVANRLLVTNEIGDYGVFDTDVPERLFSGSLTADERARLQNLSILVKPDAEWKLASLKRRLASRNSFKSSISYLIIVPTLRCNLSCSYCQVSRAPLNATGFDWTEAQLGDFSNFLESFESNHLKLEFQGGEPSLRPDLLREIIDICVRRFDSVEFVICTNLTNISGEFEQILEREDVIISTSIDGAFDVMTTNRTFDDEISRQILANFDYIAKNYGLSKISALPTITEAQIDQPRELIDTYRRLGFQSIFLRPVNHQGFARKRYSDLTREFDRWAKFYRDALSYIVDLNQHQYFEEYYASLLVRSIFADLPHGYVDFRSPSRFLTDYGVVDFDGTIYPTDEARMLSRTGHIDLSVGDLSTGIDDDKIRNLNFTAMNQVNQDCQHCVYMPHCGIDIVDDISRYGTVDVPKKDTWFCNKQMMLFDLIFEKVINEDKIWLDVFLKWIYRTNKPSPTYGLFA